MGHTGAASPVVELLIRPEAPLGPGPATTSGQVPRKTRSQSVFGSRSRSPAYSPAAITRPRSGFSQSVLVMGQVPASGVGWQELSKSECFGLLARERVGRVVFVDDLGPIVMPANFVLDRHMVVFRTDGGTKLDAAVRGSRVAFEIDGPMRRPGRAGAWSAVRPWRSPVRRSGTPAAAAAAPVGAGRQDALRAGSCPRC